jgi:hypothetical protein
MILFELFKKNQLLCGISGECVFPQHRLNFTVFNFRVPTTSEYCKETFNNQVLDCSWTYPYAHTKAPALHSLFALCHSIKSWQDLNVRNLAVIHCPSTSPGAGILIACFLKYIGTFDHTSLAYDYYCSKRYFSSFSLFFISHLFPQSSQRIFEPSASRTIL